MVSGMGVRVPLLDGSCPFPDPARHLWRVFNSLQNTRQMNYSAQQPITYAEILAYGTLMRDNLEPWEVSLIKTLDAVYLEHGGSKCRWT